ncbi:MAG: ABC transporter ATP-binding protein, partial [Thermodesulfobacteriota bacterium]
MWHGYGYFEGEQLGRPYDLRLLRRFSGYARPYRWWLLLTSLIIVAATAADLVLPYLTKVAVDRYIVVSYQEVAVGPEQDREVRRLVEKYQDLLRPSGRAGLYFLSAVASRRLDPAHLALLKKAGVIRPGAYYLVDRRPGPALDTALYRPDLFKFHPLVAAVPLDGLARLSRPELARVRTGDVSGLAFVALLAVAVLALGYFFDFIQVILLESIGQRLAHDLRQDLMAHLLRQSMSFHDRTPTGRLVARLTNDVQNLAEMIKTVAETFFKDAFILAGIVILLLHLDLALALVTFALLPPIILVTGLFRRQARDVFRELRALLARIISTFGETAAGIRVVQAFRRESVNRSRFEALNHDNYLAGLRQIKVFALFTPLIEVLSAVSLALVIWYGGASVIRETMTLGAVVAFIGYTRKFFQPIRDLAEKYNILQSAMASLERIFHLLDHHSALPEPTDPAPTPDGPGSIAFDRVGFAYPGGDRVLDDVSFRIEPGETLAIVGPTGAGKTSLINLLLRFYDPDQGRVLVDGRDVREHSLAAHRSRIGLVMQDVFLFAGTVRENIALSKTPVPAGKVETAAREVGAETFIRELPGLYDERLGEGGLTLSVGQRQLLAFARVLAQDPRILVLDEATAYIDSETEKLIESALGRLTAG